MKYKSCKHIENSLYIAPNEIRACCQRFFYNGKIRGDAKLIDLAKNQNPSEINLRDARAKMLDNLQNDEIDACKGCNLIYEKETKTKPTSKVKFLSIEQHSICNLRCTYCSPVYYGGIKSQYSVVDFIKKLETRGDLNDIEGVVWGGGEPTIDKSFAEIMETIKSKIDKNIYHRIFTNSVRYNPVLQEYLDNDMVSITTSIDAGNREQFKKIRGRDRFNEVFENLSKYAKNRPSRVTIKYILTEENSSIYELEQFIDNSKKFNLQKCCFQISTNFKNEILTDELMFSVVYLFGKLKKNNFEKIFIDDHVCRRLIKNFDKDFLKLKEYTIKNNIEDIFINEDINELIIYGSGEIVKELLIKSKSLKKLKNLYLVDSDSRKVGSYIQNIKINNSDFLKNKNNKIFIASANNYEEIYSKISSIQKTSKNIVQNLLI